MQQQLAVYAKEGFKLAELSENSMLLFKPQSNQLAKAMDIWWDQIHKFSRRDQLSLGYSLSKCGLQWFHLAERPINMRNHPDMVVTPHASDEDIILELYRQLK